MHNHTETTKYTNKQLHEAFTLKHYQCVNLEAMMHNDQKVMASLRYELKSYKDQWLRLHIEKHVSIVGDMGEALDYYFGHKKRSVYFTPSGGYYCLVDEGDCLFILFAWGNVKEYKKEIKDMRRLIQNISNSTSKPIRYTGVNNVLKNHCIEIEEGLFEIRL